MLTWSRVFLWLTTPKEKTEVFKTDDILGQSVDELVVKGIEHVSKQGENLDARAGSGIQAYNLNYILSNCRDRIHCLRNPQSVRYLSRELLLYFSGTLLAEEMAKASTFWLRLQDNDGHINSNYGYYVFHQKTPGDLSQYEWCVRLLLERPETRRAMININSIIHKTDTKDMPCNMGLQFFIQSGMLCCVAYTRSTDVITGLPYDMGFFSLLTELIWKDLSERGMTGVKLGYCMMKTCFSQLYYDKNELVETVLEKADQPTPQIMMPEINSAKMLLEDIYNKTSSSDVMQWCHTHARTR